MFRDDEIVTFKSVAELRQLITHYLARPEERTAIAARARSALPASAGDASNARHPTIAVPAPEKPVRYIVQTPWLLCTADSNEP